MWRLILLIALVASGCTQVDQSLSPSKFYKRDVRITYDGVSYLGVAVLPGGKKHYDLEMTFAGQLDLFTFRTCHREVTQEDAGGGRIFGKRNKVAFRYSPVNEIESEDYCAVQIGGYEISGGRHSWGFIDFETPLETLNAKAMCNGRTQFFNGVSVCQSPAGLLQKVVFERPVTVKHTDDCPELLTIDDKTFDIYPPLGRCVYSFRSIEEPRDFHRMTIIGYEDILIRRGD